MAHTSSPQHITFSKRSVKAIIQQLDGQEPPYPVYYFGRTIKTERPERPGKCYRWVTDIPEVIC